VADHKRTLRNAVLALIRARIEATDGEEPGRRSLLRLGDGTVSLEFGNGYFNPGGVMVYESGEVVPNDHPADAGGTDWEWSPDQAADYFADRLFEAGP